MMAVRTGDTSVEIQLGSDEYVIENDRMTEREFSPKKWFIWILLIALLLLLIIVVFVHFHTPNTFPNYFNGLKNMCKWYFHMDQMER